MPVSRSEQPEGPPLLAGRYELGARLGHGGMADVYRAMDRVLSRPVAVKMLREATAEDSDRARFIGEARTLARLSHSGLVTVLDAGFGTGAATGAPPLGLPRGVVSVEQPFLVMELVEGPTLTQVIAAGPLPTDEVGSIGVQVALALAYVHGHGVVHRDVKPGNVLLGGEHRVKLADFGIARLLGDAVRHTRTGHAIGTAAYLAPEQVTGQEVSGATDVYSLGLVLLEALTGRREYPGTPTEAALARLHRPPQLPAELPEPWRRLLADMTVLDPARRPDAAAVADRLHELPTGPIPVTTEGSPDERTVPLLAPSIADPGTTQTPASPDHGTRVLTDTVQPAPAAAAPAPRSRTSLIDRTGGALARQPARIADGVRAVPPAQRAVFAVIAAITVVITLVLVLVAVLDGGANNSSDIPDNTPTQLRDPLQELHDAVNGADR